MKYKKYITLLAFLFFLKIKSFSQCAMCKAVVETNIKEGGKAGIGLNDGILYLMAMPYLGMFLFAFFYYFQKKKKSAA